MSYTNLITNPSFEIDTSNWDILNGGETFTRDLTEHYDGVASGKVVCPGALPADGIFYGATSRPAITAGGVYTASAWMKAASGTLRMGIQERNAGGASLGNTFGVATAFSGGWLQCSMVFTAQVGAVSCFVFCETDSAQAITFYVDLATLWLNPTSTIRQAPVMGRGASW